MIFETPFFETLIYSMSVYGLYILFKHLKFPDISTDNVFSFGSITFAFYLFTFHNFFIALLFTFISGFLVGTFTSLLYSKFKIPKLLAGIITYSILFSINLKFFRKPNIYIPNNMLPKYLVLVLLVINILAFIFFVILLRSKLGKSINTFGNNTKILKEFGAPTGLILILGCGFANAFISLSGALTSTYFGFSDISIGIGILINSVAAIIIAENIILYFPKKLSLLIIPLSVFLYHLILFLVIRYLSFGFLDYSDYKLISGVIIILFFLISNKKTKEIVSF